MNPCSIRSLASSEIFLRVEEEIQTKAFITKAKGNQIYQNGNQIKWFPFWYDDLHYGSRLDCSCIRSLCGDDIC